MENRPGSIDSPSPGGQYVSANGLEIYYQESGIGQPLILVHGAMDTHRLWDPHLANFQDRFRVIRPDSRGHGRTFNPSRKLSYRLMADDLAAMIGELGLIKPFLFGYSDGGQAVLDLGIRYPDLPGALVIGGAWYQFSKEYQAAISGMGFVAPGVVDLGVYQRQAHPDWRDRLRAAHLDPDPDYPGILLEGLARMWWTTLGYSEADFQKINVPTLILIGEKDEIIPVGEARELTGLIPDAELAVIPGATHNRVLVPGGLFLDQIRIFFASLA